MKSLVITPSHRVATLWRWKAGSTASMPSVTVAITAKKKLLKRHSIHQWQ